MMTRPKDERTQSATLRTAERLLSISSRRAWWDAYGMTAVLIALIALATMAGFLLTTDNRWSAPLVGITAIVAVLALGENRRMRTEMAASVDENRQMRVVMHEALLESQRMRQFTEKARAQDVRPTVRIDWIDYHEAGDYTTAIVFRNWGPGIAVLREVRFVQISTGTMPTVNLGETSINALHHGVAEIVVWPKESLHTPLRGGGTYLFQMGFATTFRVTAVVFNINGEIVDPYDRQFEMAASDFYASNERGPRIGEWFDERGQVGGIG